MNAETGADATVNARRVAVSAVFAAVAGAVLWPPGAVYWTAVAATVGEAATLALVVVAAIALGAAFGALTGVRVREFAAGTAGAYLLGMAAIAAARSPDSPVHLFLYGAVAACLVVGVAAARVRAGAPRRSDD
ncbi:hypothetical protein I7X12_09190 [Halosimplex litoreum]|uniref:Uncharacterized protein n=1 Tax=Halosimplex litoreum TaxID=1198301 RepID=A0A7U3WAW1_9EURY|nr:hypothetical protein [Halosimplex litoreum]QPV64756.1 hypothetical protein I7X12_09190 [Halosimplex litoreum]